ncbi:hypothetical protein CR513_27814, partial [Mucuna pruriens]
MSLQVSPTVSTSAYIDKEEDERRLKSIQQRRQEKEPTPNLGSSRWGILDVPVKIRNFNHEVALHSMFMALKVELFADSLGREPPIRMDNLRTRVTDYIQMEEMVVFRDSVRAGKPLAPYNHKEHENSGKTNRKKGRNKGSTWEPKYQVFTPSTLVGMHSKKHATPT